MIKNNVLECIGDTPLIRLDKIKELWNLPFDLFAKFERNNPSGSIKDRAALFIIKDAIDEKRIDKDTLIVEATSGNTGIALAMICAYLSLRLIITMPSSASIERIKMMKMYGAEVVLTDAALGMKGSVDEALKIAKQSKKSFIPSQFENPSNPRAHLNTTAKEIDDDLKDNLKAIVGGFGTGGTLMGIAEYFENRDVKIIGVEPASSPLLTKNAAGPHKIQGIGANFIPKIVNKDKFDKIIDIDNDDAFDGVRLLAKNEGLLCGISSGAALMAIKRLKDDNMILSGSVVVILPDNGERYLSVDEFNGK